MLQILLRLFYFSSKVCVQGISLQKYIYFISLSMIAVLSSEENIAFGRPTNGSRALSHGSPSSNAVDGDTNGNYPSHSCTHTFDSDGGSAYPWWAVDLGSPRHIDTVYIYNRVDCECDFCTCIESGVCFHSISVFWNAILMREQI